MFFRQLLQLTRDACAFDFARAGKKIAAKSTRHAMATTSSVLVKAPVDLVRASFILASSGLIATG
jgi:hypothetical protein